MKIHKHGKLIQPEEYNPKYRTYFKCCPYCNCQFETDEYIYMKITNTESIRPSYEYSYEDFEESTKETNFGKFVCPECSQEFIEYLMRSDRVSPLNFLNENKIKRTVIMLLVMLFISLVLTIIRHVFGDNIILISVMMTSWAIFVIYGILCMISSLVFGDYEYEHHSTYKSKNSESFIEE